MHCNLIHNTQTLLHHSLVMLIEENNGNGSCEFDAKVQVYVLVPIRVAMGNRPRMFAEVFGDWIISGNV